MYSAGMFLSSLSDMVRVFPVPVGPIHRTYNTAKTGTKMGHSELHRNTNIQR